MGRQGHGAHKTAAYRPVFPGDATLHRAAGGQRCYSPAEVDYLAAPTSHVLLIEVKAGPGGAMRSLHQFMAGRDLSWAMRFNSAPPMRQPIDTVTSTGQAVAYELLSLPAYAVECLPRLAKEMDADVQG